MNKKEYTKNLMNYFGIKARNFNINYNKKRTQAAQLLLAYLQ